MERCSPSSECPLFPTCFEDDHHIYHPEKLVRRLAGVAFFLAHVERDVCRAAHEQLHLEQSNNIPSREQIEAWHKEQNDQSEVGRR